MTQAVRDGYAEQFYPRTEELGPDEMRITALGTGRPFLRRSQANASWLIELGNGDKFVFDFGYGSQMNFTALEIPYQRITAWSATHLHTDHVGDFGQVWVGSWAGAMGQSQFMPSSFHQFAVDHDGDGRRDIWGTLPDVFASAANYLARTGWKGDETWGRQVRLPDGFDGALAGLDVTKALEEWQALGVRRADGDDLPQAQMAASVILPGGPEGPAFLTYHNYRVLLKWNRSHYFATTVGQFADILTAR